MRRWINAAALLALGCGGSEADIDVPPTCAVSFTVVGSEPVVAPATVVARSAFATDLIGVRFRSWDVTFGGLPVAFNMRDPDGEAIEFIAAEPGPYEVTLTGLIGDEVCAPGSRALNVQAGGALRESYLVRVLSPTGTEYAQALTVFGGADLSLGTIDMNANEESLILRDEGGVALDAYARFVPADFLGTGAETATSPGGRVTVALAAGLYDLEVTPYDAGEAPFVVRGLVAPDLPGTLTAPTPVDFATSVSDGGALSGARIRLAVDSGPGAVATTGGAGTASLSVSPGTIATVDVVPPEGSGLPRVAGNGSTLDGTVSVDYLTVDSRSLSLTIVDEADQFIPSARLVLDGSVANAAQIDFGEGAVTVPGRFTATLTANGSGVIPATTVPNGVYTAVILRDDAPPTVLDVDLRTGQISPAQLQAAAAESVLGNVSFAGSALNGARVRAVASGVLAGLAADSPQTSSIAGQFTLALASGGEYELVVEGDVDAGYAAGRTVFTASPLAGPLALSASSAVRVDGRIVDGATPLARAHVVLIDPLTGVSVARAITDADGNFVFAAPDPGTN